jgi:hypothetical protein
MNKERDLLPWVLGALSATAVAVAITAISSTKTAAPLGPTAPAPAPPAAPAVAAAAPVPEADPMPPQSTIQAQAAPEPPAQTGQIWECTTKGVKTFSNNPCGDKSTLLEVGPINTMNPTPAIHYARTDAPEPRYAPGYANSDSYADEEPYSDPVSAESGGNSYTIIQGVGFVARRRPEHPHHRPTPNHRNPGPMPRRY